eukprot:CAMPEP_0117766382 /NCGR_PEP_ID=MMETSP0947-20121206/20825_1 /TAXON_ID=44440 /ORGANISM="Chattonella subsalsa, Strain CCMP2191" /LENGTH=1408 /DNA_ID=CAMNT_0005589519 /DNA_START=352 /DNA_END=4575 /DNA_ORIENTATION=-
MSRELDYQDMSYSYNDTVDYGNCSYLYYDWIASNSSCDIDTYFATNTITTWAYCNITYYSEDLFSSASSEAKASCLEEDAVVDLVECMFDLKDDEICPEICYTEVKNFYERSGCDCDFDIPNFFETSNITITNDMICNMTDFVDFVLEDDDSNCEDCEAATDVISCAYDIFVLSQDLECQLTCMNITAESAIFNSYGTSFAVTFDMSTDRAGFGTSTFDCNELLDFEGVDDIECKWTSNTVLYVGVSGGLSLTTSDSITVIGDIFYEGNSKNCPDSYSLPETELNLEAPSDAAVPSVSFGSVSATYDSCADIDIDASGSIAGCSPTYEWALVDSSVSADGLSNLLSSSSESYVSVLNANVTAGASYTIGLTITNCLGQSGNATVSFSVSSSPVPSLSIQGGTSFSIYKTDSLTLTALGSYSGCGSSCSSGSGLTYSWNVSDSGVEYSSVGNSIIFSSGAFDAASSYTVEVTVKDCNDKTNSVTVYLTILSSDLVADISGGNSRFISSASDYVLDGSNSYDPDGGDITYNWNCTDYTGAACSASGSGQKLNISAGDLVDDDDLEPYTIILYVSSTSDTRVAMDYQFLYVTTDAVPQIEIITSSAKLNPSVDNTISAYIDTSEGDVTAVWSVDDETPLEYGSGHLTPNTKGVIEKYYDQGDSDGLATFNIVLKSGAIDTEGSSYTLYLTATFDDTGASSYATISFVSNEAPTPGTLTVDPTSGTELTTAFTATLSGWVDEDLPLQYSFFFKTNVNSANKQTLQSTSYDNSANEFLLSAGGNWIVGTVQDSYDAKYTLTSSKIEVDENEGATVANLTSIASSAMTTYFAEGNFDAVASTLSALTSAVVDDSIDCSGAPDCQAYNRNNCSETANTCGECFDGYYGYDGDANSPCVVPAADCSDGTQNGNETDTDCGGNQCAPCELDDACLADSDCESGRCYENVCSEKIKACPTSKGIECGGTGTCYYKHKSSGKEKSSTWCIASNDLCQAYCDCDTGYNGIDCSQSDADVQQVLDAVSVVFQQVANVLDSIGDTATADTIETYSAILSSSTSNAEVFDEDTASEALSVLSAILPDDDTEISDAAAVSFISTISSLFDYIFTSSDRRRLSEGQRRLLTTTEKELIASTKSVCNSLLSSFAGDGYCNELTEDQIQLSYCKYLGADLAGTFVYSAQSDDQIDGGIEADGFRQVTGLSDADTYEIMSFTFSSTEMSDSTISLLYLVDLDTSDSRRLLDDSTNIVRIGFITEQDFVDEVTETYAGDCPTTHTYSNSVCGEYTVSCGSTYTSYSLECVSNSTAPECLLYDNTTNTYDSSVCSVVNYTSSYVYCDCGDVSGLIYSDVLYTTGSQQISFSTAAPAPSPTTAAPTAPSATVPPTASPTAPMGKIVITQTDAGVQARFQISTLLFVLFVTW